MGDSIFAKTDTKKQAKMMLDFLSKEYRTINSILHEKYPNKWINFKSYVWLADYKRLSNIGRVRDKNNLVGFEYNDGPPETALAEEIIKWVTRTIGRSERVYYYNGDRQYSAKKSMEDIIEDKARALMIANHSNGRKIDKDLEHFKNSVAVINYLGLRNLNAKISYEDVINIIKEEIQRLDKKWEKYLESNK